MVGPYLSKKSVRSYVRIPYYWSNTNSNAIICDLGRISTMAAVISVPQTQLPRPTVLVPLPLDSTTTVRPTLQTCIAIQQTGPKGKQRGTVTAGLDNTESAVT